MPELKEYSTSAPEALDDLASKEVQRRTGLIETAWKYYDGYHRKQLKVRAGQSDDNVILNLVSKVINQSVSLLFGSPPQFELDENEDTAEEQLLADILDANKLPILLHNTALSGALSGHCFWKIIPENDSVRIINLKPQLVTVFWNPDDQGAVTCYRIAWKNSAGDWTRQDIVRLDDESWLIRDMVKPELARDWRLVDEKIWGWSFAPVLDWQNLPESRVYYGAPDLANPALNDRVNFVASNILRIIKYHAHPRSIGIGMSADQVQESAIDSLWTIPSSDANVFNLEMSSDLTSSMRMLQSLQQAFYSEHRAVDLTVLSDKLGQITNFGLRTLFKDALDKLETKRELYGAALREAVRRILILAEVEAPAPRLHWPDALPFNGLEEIQEIRQELELNLISKRTAANIRGRDWAVEQGRLLDEQQQEENLGGILLRAFERGGV